MLGKKVSAVCPTCHKHIEGKIYQKDDAVLLDKECPEHGLITDVLSSNAAMFLDRMSLLDHQSPNRCTSEKCKNGIFKCADHIAKKSPLAFIEITTRCNMRCPVCYADAEARGKDMSLEDISKILDKIKEEDPRTHVILIGGEPTIHKEFFKVLELVRDKDLMKRAFIATNGITMANKEFAKKVHNAGIKKFFLGFDGTDREACKEIRGTYLAHDSLREALKNIRENGKAWIILSITAVKDINVEEIPGAIEFAMDNSDMVRRIMISPEVYCGRINETEDLVKTRLTGDCVEAYLRKSLKIKVATVSLSLFFAILKPLKSMGLVDPEGWVASMPSPFCGNMGFLWKDKNGEYRSMIDLLVKDADKNVYEAGRRVNKLADEIAASISGFPDDLLGKIRKVLATYFSYLPKYFFLVFSYLNKGNLLSVLWEFIKCGFNAKKFKKSYFSEKRMELFYLLGSDRYNFIWEKMPYCLTHHYRVHPKTKEVIKLAGCFVFAFREELEKEQDEVL